MTVEKVMIILTLAHVACGNETLFNTIQFSHLRFIYTLVRLVHSAVPEEGEIPAYRMNAEMILFTSVPRQAHMSCLTNTVCKITS